MPNGTEPATLPAPEQPTTPIQNVEAPEKVDEIFRKAAEQLEYVKEPEQTSLPEPEKEPDSAPEPEKKAAPKAKKKAKEPEPAPEPEPEPAAEPKKSKRELFREKADAEKAYRDKEARLKDREAELLKKEEDTKRLELALREFQADPISYLEKLNPRAYEEWTARNLAGGKPKENTETAELRAEIAKLREEIKGTREQTTSEVGRARYIQYMSDANRILAKEEFAPVREFAAMVEELQGAPYETEKAIASIWADYKQNYEKELTAEECCEILLEDAQSYLERVPKSQRLRSLFGLDKPAEEKKPPKKSPPKSGRTLTNELESASAPAREPDLSHIRSKEELLTEAAKLLEYQEEE